MGAVGGDGVSRNRSYVVPGALVPVEIDRERDEGHYLEPNVWMVHPPSAAELRARRESSRA
jgi:hypothetical protein